MDLRNKKTAITYQILFLSVPSSALLTDPMTRNNPNMIGYRPMRDW